MWISCLIIAVYCNFHGNYSLPIITEKPTVKNGGNRFIFPETLLWATMAKESKPSLICRLPVRRQQLQLRRQQQLPLQQPQQLPQQQQRHNQKLPLFGQMVI